LPGLLGLHLRDVLFRVDAHELLLLTGVIRSPGGDERTLVFASRAMGVGRKTASDARKGMHEDRIHG
jgi:hypothetical protein